jgi:transposase-like protein
MRDKQGGRREFWTALIGKQKRSGQSVRTFCQEQGVSQPSFYYWRQQLGGERRGPVQFALVETGGSASRTDRGVELELAGGVRLQVQPGADAATLRMVLAVLREGA